MLALIDGDELCYGACESRWRNEKGQVVVLLNKEEKEFTAEEDRRHLEKSWKNLQRLVQETCNKIFASDYLMAVKGPTNYRDDMYPAYKQNRKKPASKTNNIVPLLRKLAVREDLAIEATYREADDMLRIWATQATLAGDDFVIVSQDKDLDCIPGKHFNMRKNVLREVSAHDALRFEYRQLLSGDPTDNIPGVPQIGPIKAEAFLANTITEEEMQEIVVEQYLNAYGDEWRAYLLSNGKMTYLQKHANDFFTLADWPVANGVIKPAPPRPVPTKPMVKLPVPKEIKAAPFTGKVPLCMG